MNENFTSNTQMLHSTR